jgi:hypothetical protein
VPHVKREALFAALGWLGDRTLEVLEPRPEWQAGVKRISEAAMLADVLLAPSVAAIHPKISAYADAWLDAAWRALGAGDFLCDRVEEDPVWAGLAMTYVKFHKHGRRNARFLDLVQRRAHEVRGDPFVKLAVACAFRELGVTSALDVDELTRQSWIARADDFAVPEPLEAYHTTHVALWLGELGRIPEWLARRLKSYTPLWISHYQRRENVDLVAELIMQAHHVGAPPLGDVWAWLLARQEGDGSFPGIDLPSVTLGRYHPTLVSALALALCLGQSLCRCPCP